MGIPKDVEVEVLDCVSTAAAAAAAASSVVCLAGKIGPQQQPLQTRALRFCTSRTTTKDQKGIWRLSKLWGLTCCRAASCQVQDMPSGAAVGGSSTLHDTVKKPASSMSVAKHCATVARCDIDRVSTAAVTTTRAECGSCCPRGHQVLGLLGKGAAAAAALGMVILSKMMVTGHGKAQQAANAAANAPTGEPVVAINCSDQASTSRLLQLEAPDATRSATDMRWDRLNTYLAAQQLAACMEYAALGFAVGHGMMPYV